MGSVRLKLEAVLKSCRKSDEYNDITRESFHIYEVKFKHQQVKRSFSFWKKFNVVGGGSVVLLCLRSKTNFIMKMYKIIKKGYKVFVVHPTLPPSSSTPFKQYTQVVL